MTSRILIILSAILIYCCCLFVLPLFSLATIDSKSVQKLRVSTMSECEYFTSISSSADTVVINAVSGCDDRSNFVYVLARDDNSCWHQQTKLSMLQISWVMHDNVSLSGDTVAVYVRYGDYPDYTDAVYIFVRSGTSWSQQEKLIIPNTNWLRNISLSGDTLAVSTNSSNDADDAVHIFVRSGTSWSQQAKLSIPDTNWLRDISLSGDTVAVSANSSNDADDAVHIFVRSGTSWSQQAKLAVHGDGYLQAISTSEKKVFFTEDEYQKDPFGVESSLYIYSDDVCIRKNALPAIIMQLLNSRK